MNYPESLDWLFASQLHGIHLGLENIHFLLDSLHIPLTGPSATKCIHVAGTNGKGSTSAILEACARSAGLKTGLFTSPHLVSFRERIQINRQLISENDVASGLTEIRQIIDASTLQPTFFEITTALALAHFHRSQLDLVILETGLGGRLDATNVVTPLVSVITQIDWDHQAYLGNSLPAIALEKAGIIKPHVPVVTTPQTDEVRSLLVQIALHRHAPISFVATPLSNLPIALPGDHQRWNAALALHALELAGLHLPAPLLAEALRSVDWPGRFQSIPQGFILDGAHNPAAAHCLAQTWLATFGPKRANVILGSLEDKDFHGICSALRPILGLVLAVPVRNPRSLSPKRVCEILGEISPSQECVAMRNLPAALALAQSLSRRTLITGSLFLVGESLAHFQNTPLENLSTQ